MRLTGHYTVARMLERNDFEKRYKENQPIAIQEFMYPLLQAYDSVALQADVELGGTDQKFNLLLGRTLQEHYGVEPQVCLMLPLLVGTDGVDKMSKSLGNYIGINEPAQEIYGKTLSIPDEMIIPYFVLVTDVPKAEIEQIADDLRNMRINPRDPKRRLARELVTLYHSKEAAEKAEAEVRQDIFQERRSGRLERSSRAPKRRACAGEVDCRIRRSEDQFRGPPADRRRRSTTGRQEDFRC